MEMNIKQIKNIVQNYKELEELVSSKIYFLSKLDKEYNIFQGIESIEFNNDIVYVTSYYTSYGEYNTSSFSIPLEWISKSDSELDELVEINKKLKLEQERKTKEEKEQREKEQREKEEREKEEYKRLKAKYDIID